MIDCFHLKRSDKNNVKKGGVGEVFEAMWPITPNAYP